MDLKENELTLNTTEKKLMYGIYERLGVLIDLLTPKQIVTSRYEDVRDCNYIKTPNQITISNINDVKEVVSNDNKGKSKRAKVNNT